MAALCLVLAGCGTSASVSNSSSGAGADQKSSNVTITEVRRDEVNDKDFGKASGATASLAAKDVRHNKLSTCLGSIAEKAADDHGNPLVTKDKARELFEFTIEEESYELPCPITTFLEKGDGWIFEQAYSFEDMVFEPDYSFDVDLWYREDENYNVTVKLKNMSDETVEDWKKLTVVGIAVRPMESYVSFESKADLGQDSSLDKFLEVLGCNDESVVRDDVTVEYHVSLFEKPFYDVTESIFGKVTYEWNKVGKAMTLLSFELEDPWDADLRKTDEELAADAEKREQEPADNTEGIDLTNVGRTVEGV